MKYQFCLFDLDGTLTDPGIGITNSVMYALKKYNIHVADRSELYSFIGPPLQDSFRKYYGFSKEQVNQAVEYYREYFRAGGIYENSVYDGIPELLEDLKRELNQSVTGEPTTDKYDLYYFGYNRRLQYNSDQTEKAKTIPLFDEVQLKSFIDEELIPAADTTKSNQETHILVLGYAIQADSLDTGVLNNIERNAYLTEAQLTKIFGIVERKAGEA